MRRLVLALIMFASPVQAWTFSAGPVCTLSHSEGGMDVAITYDPRLQVPYELRLTASDAWPSAQFFGIAFQGGQDNTISTPLHRISPDGKTLSVTDEGFGNVLNGLEFNRTAVIFTGNVRRVVSLGTAPEPVRAFRACAAQTFT